MFLKGKLIRLFEDDDTIYRLLLITLFFVSPLLHFLFYGHVYDPLSLRILDSIFCLITLALSFLNKPLAYRISKYITLTSYLVVNNFVLLSANGFASEYLFCSVNLFVVLTLFCKETREFLAISAINFVTIVGAYFATSDHEISLPWLVLILLAFDSIAALSFLIKVAYRLKFKKAVKNITQLNGNLLKNDERLRESKKQLTALINSINDIIFELDLDRRYTNVWYNTARKWHFTPEALMGKLLSEVVGEEKAKPLAIAFDKVEKDKKQVDIEFQSVFGADMWFAGRFVPIFNNTGDLDRVAVAVSDITAQKKYEIALRENQEHLVEAQIIAKIGNWWFDDGVGENYWSENLYRILEIEEAPDAIGASRFEYYMELVHPDDVENTRQYFTNIRTHGLKEFTHKLITPKGNLKYIKVSNGDFELEASGSNRISGIIQDVTDIKLAEKAMRMSQIELVEAQTIAKIGNWKWDLKSNDISWSDEIFRIYEVAISSHTKAGIIKLMLQCVHPDDMHIIRDFLKTSGKGIYKSYDYRIITPAGNLKHLSVIIGKVMYTEDGGIRKLIGTLQDVTERREAEIESLRTRSKFQTVLETIKLAAISLDEKGNVTFCNTYLANLLGYEQSEMIGMNLMETFLPEYMKQMVAEWFKQNDIPSNYINPLVCRNGDQRVINWQNTITYDDDGNVLETTSIGEDITDQQIATQALVTAKEQAERLSRSKSEFLSVMSHEIRTPMNAVIGTTNLLMSENPRPEQMEYLNTLKFSGENLLAIINDILDYNKIEAGKLELSKSPFNIRHLIGQIKQSFYPRAAEKKLDIEVLMDDAMPSNIMGDQMRLSQILNNLLSNAIKFTAWGKVSIRLDHELRDENRILIKFSVIDTGIGIASENLQRIFEPFMQESEFTYNSYGGTGLGLAITKKLIEMHGSYIGVQSEPGKGTRFSFDIAFDIQPKAEEPKVLNVDLSADAARSLAGMKILLVDDNKMNLMIASKFLKKWDVVADEALNGQIAADMTREKEYDLIIMDLQMPVMDGFEATAIIKQQYPNLPIIALTADAMPETFEKALAAGMNDYLTKPFVPDVLFSKVYQFKKQLVGGE